MKVPSRFRSSFVFFILSLGFFLVIGRAIQFQVAPDPRLKKIASGKERLNKQQQVEDLITSRGAIVDRNGADLALSIIVKSFFANPKLIKNPAATAQALAPLLDIPASKLRNTLSQEKYFVWLKREVNESVAKKIEALSIEGVYSRKESKRIYPHGELGRSVVGVSGLDGLGLEGIEKSYDRYLKSQDRAGDVGIRDALGRLLLFDDFEKEWFESYRIVSTIDIRLQRIVEEELFQTLKEKQALSAQAIMMNPKTGEIMAMASFDGKRPDSQPLRNRVVSDVYEPGSTFKIVLAAAALEHLGMNANSQIFGENGSFRVGNHTIREFHNKKYGWLTLQELLEVSSNVASAKLGLKIGASDFESTIRKFGFGAESGIDLPGEASGLLRSASSWKPIELANIAFGQGLAITPLQIVRAVSAIANGGVIVKPYIVSTVRAPKAQQKESQIIWQVQPEEKEILSAEKARLLTEMLTHVTEEGSTGFQASIEGYHIAGKTGTAQKLIETVNSRGKTIKTYSSDHSVVSFVGFVPAFDPSFVLLVLYDDPQGKASGGTLAAPSFRRIASKSLAVLGVPPESSRSHKVQVSEATQGNRFVGRSFQDVLKEIRSLPEDQRAQYDLIGFGTAIREEILEDQRMKIYFK